MKKAKTRINMITALVALLMIVVVDKTISQDILKDTIEWHVATEMHKVKDSLARSYDSHFITYGKNRIELIRNRSDENGEIYSDATQINIDKSTGNWNNITLSGQVSFQVLTKICKGDIKINIS